MGDGWQAGAESLISIFIHDVTQGREDARSVQGFILSFWCESRELGGSASPRFPCVIPLVARFSSEILRGIINCWAESHLKSCQTSMMELLRENNQLQDIDKDKKLTASTEKHHCRR